MKRDKEWLLTELRNIDSTDNSNEFDFGYETAIDLAIDLVDQLEETQSTNHFDEENFRQWVVINLWGARVMKSSMRTTWVEGKELEDFLVNAVKGNLEDSEITEAQAWETLAPRFSMLASELERQVLDGFLAMTAEEIEMESDKIKKLADGIKKLHAENEELKAKLDEPEKVVVPQFVADFIEKCKDVNRSLYGAYNIMPTEVQAWAIEHLIEGTWSWQDTFATIWLNGYEVEKEPLYYAKIKGHEFINTGIILDDDTGEDVSEWNRHIYFIQQMDGNVVIDMKDSGLNGAKHFMTIKEWAELGINEANAEFEPVEESK